MASRRINNTSSEHSMHLKGELYELSKGLVSQYALERKDAIERVIAAMTVGKDVSPLFTDVLKNIATHDLVQKKLVYLYLINYAKSHPDLCILAVNTFVQDSNDPNPLVRALAIRTMGCIRVEKILDFLTEPLRKALIDESSYVRKTAAICVAKLFDLDVERCMENNFLEALKDMISDPNPIVVASVATALSDIHSSHPNIKAFDIDAKSLKKLLAALNECNEWGRVSILEAISRYKSDLAQELEHICERVTPQLQHANSSVVMSALKVLLRFYDQLRPGFQISLRKKLTPPLVSLISSSPSEIQYAVLRNIILLLQKFPDLFSKEFNCFFCKYDDPYYIKREKLNILTLVINEQNSKDILNELKDYVSEVEVEFVKKAIECIGNCALRLECSTHMCISILRDLIRTKVSHVVQASTIALQYIMRGYPYQYITVASEIGHLWLEDEISLDEPDSRASFIWILGEYSEQLPSSEAILTQFAQGFNDESTQVQFQILLAVVKVFLKTPKHLDTTLQTIFKKATMECDNPDTRDRAYFYWRLLSSDITAARQVILKKKDVIEPKFQQELSKDQLHALIGEFSTLAAVFHKMPTRFLSDDKTKAQIEFEAEDEGEDKIAIDITPSKEPVMKSNIEHLLDLSFDDGQTDIKKSDTNAIDSLQRNLAALNSTWSQSQNNKALNANDILNVSSYDFTTNQQAFQPAANNASNSKKDLLDLL